MALARRRQKSTHTLIGKAHLVSLAQEKIPSPAIELPPVEKNYITKSGHETNFASVAGMTRTKRAGPPLEHDGELSVAWIVRQARCDAGF